MNLADSERRLIQILRAAYCAELRVAVEHGVLVRVEVVQKVMLDRPVAGQVETRRNCL